MFMQIDIFGSLYFFKLDFQTGNYWVKSYKLFLTFETLPNCFFKTTIPTYKAETTMLESIIFTAPSRFQNIFLNLCLIINLICGYTINNKFTLVTLKP